MTAVKDRMALLPSIMELPNQAAVADAMGMAINQKIVILENDLNLWAETEALGRSLIARLTDPPAGEPMIRRFISR